MIFCWDGSDLNIIKQAYMYMSFIKESKDFAGLDKEFAMTTTTASGSNPPNTEEDALLSRASHLTRLEVLLRRSRNLKQLRKCYKDHYWALMEELKVKHRDYYWNHGVSPFTSSKRDTTAAAVDGVVDRRCSSVGCKLTAMALTSFYHLHILSDSKQRLYKACDFVIKRYT